MHTSAATFRSLLGCNVYISEGRNMQLIRRLEAICHQHPRSVVLAHTFIDEPYNRTGLTLAASDIFELAATVQSLAQQVVSHINLRHHAAQHPRLGVLDHVSVHPVGPDATLPLAAQAAAAIGQQLCQPPLQLPVYYYGAAHPSYRKLAEIRRQLGYFKPSQDAAATGSGGDGTSWNGSISQLQLRAYPPDAGPQVATEAAGVVTIGAVPWVTNFNVPLYTTDIAAAKAVARSVATKGGGLPGVEAMALPHGPGVIEVATNLVAYNSRQLDKGTAAATPATPLASSALMSEAGSKVYDMAGLPSTSQGSHLTQDDRNITQDSHSSPNPATWGFDQQGAGAGPEEVTAAVALLAQQHGLPPPGPGYITNKTPAELISIAAKQLS